MKAVFALLAFTLATANAGNIMDLITEQSVGGKIVEITFDGCDQDYDEECIAERGSTVSNLISDLNAYICMYVHTYMFYVLTIQCIYEIGDWKIEVPTYSICRNSKVPIVRIHLWSPNSIPR